MTTPAETPTPDLVAGLSLRAPQLQYEITGLPFGGAALMRIRGVTSPFSSIALALTDEAAARCASEGGAGAKTVTLTLHELRDYGPSLHDDAARTAGLRALIVDRALLSHPTLIEGVRPSDATLTLAESETLQLLSALGAHALGKASRRARECAECSTQRRAREEREKQEQMAAHRRKLEAAKSPKERRAIESELWTPAFQNAYFARSSRERDCPHVALAMRCLAAICERAPEVAFELIGLIEPEGSDSTRFVVHREAFRVMASRWLTGRAHSRYEDFDPRRFRRHGRGAQRGAWTGVRDRARAAKGLPPEQRAAVSYAATAWSYDAPVDALGWSGPANEADEAPPSLSAEPDGEEVAEVSRALPAFAQRSVASSPPPPAEVKAAKGAAVKRAKKAADAKEPAPKGAPAKGVPAKGAPAKGAPAKGAPAKGAPAKATKRETVRAAPAMSADDTRSILLKIGIPAALIDEMERDGTLAARAKKR